MKNKLFLIKGFYSILLSFAISLCLSGQEVKDYKSIFKGKYSDALHFLEKEKWIFDSLKAYQVDESIAISTVFPEIIRYSSLRNHAETAGLMVLYTQYGEHYSDFSVGYFQMKPSFAGRLEKDWNKYLHLERPSAAVIPPFDTIDNNGNRLQRVRRLNDLQWQVKYIAIFMKIMESKTCGTSWTSSAEKLKFIATAYNTGYWKDKKTIEGAATRTDFHTSVLKPDTCYNYAEIALDFYLGTYPTKP